MNNDQWFHNRLRGDFAENLAMTHFSALGYRVERTGIEHTAPFYANLQHAAKSRNYDVSSYLGKVFNFHSKFPDFIASRVTPKRNGDPIMNAIFIEVKYRKNVDLALFRSEVQEQYKEYVASGYPVFIYLLCKSVKNEADIAFKSTVSPKSFRVLFCYLGHKSALWWEAGSRSFDNNPIYEYKGNGNTESFNRIYKDIIIKHLDELSE